ncbi:MAG: hypothetical protein ACQER7_03040 [Bacteroidota bacterium]
MCKFLHASFGMNGFSSLEKAEVDKSFQNDYCQNKVMMHETGKVNPWNGVFPGNSITDRGMWSEWFTAVPVFKCRRLPGVAEASSGKQRVGQRDRVLIE